MHLLWMIPVVLPSSTELSLLVILRVPVLEVLCDLTVRTVPSTVVVPGSPDPGIPVSVPWQKRIA